jgi:hypothetical protein
MSGPSAWPGEQNPIAKVAFMLITGFNAEGQPMYRKGTVDSVEERTFVQSLLEPLRPVPHTIASVTMGEITITLQDGREITLQPVFRPSMDRYRDLFFVEEWQYPMPAKFGELLDKWRKQPPT